ncbi:MAG: radical SAM protein [Nitrospinae bacterium]|nr:radical SAM protein [Nitrospinota bacterium]
MIGDIFVEKPYQDFILNECDGVVFIPHILDLQIMRDIKNISKEIDIPGVCTRQEQNILDNNKKPIYFQGGFPRHELFLKKGYRFPFARHLKFATVTTLWGCPFSCSYCTDSKMPPIIRPHNDVFKELQYLTDLGVKELFFADKTFGYPHKNSFPLLEEMALKFKFQFSCYVHPQTYTPKLFELMKAAGCKTIIIGVDSANLPSLKQYNRKVMKQNIDNLLIKARQLDINVCADFILGLEHETEVDIKTTINYALKLPIDYASFNIAAPLPGSDIRQRAIETGQLSFGNEGLDTFGSQGVLGNKNIDYEKLKKMRNKAIVKFYLRPTYLIRRLMKTSSLEHFYIQFEEMFSMMKKTFFTKKAL